MAGEKLFDKLQRKVHTMKSKKNMKKTKSTKREAKETVRKQCVATPAKN